MTSTMRAAPCVASVIMPAWLPVNERASKPIEWIAIASSAIEMRSPLESSMSSSRGAGIGATCAREVEQLVGRVAHRAHGDDDVVPGTARVDDALGDALDALGVGDGRAAVLLHDQRHDGTPGDAAGRRANLVTEGERMPRATAPSYGCASCRARSCDGSHRPATPLPATLIASRREDADCSNSAPRAAVWVFSRTEGAHAADIAYRFAASATAST